MPKILIVKTSSLGDLIHTMPAITDVQRMLPHAEVHWLVEEGFADIPAWHPFIKKVHRCAIRRWRKGLISAATHKEIAQLKNTLIEENYDLVIDAQGLLKSALMVRWLNAEKHGYDKNSIKEKLASVVYDVKHTISRELSAIERVRILFSRALGYSLEGLVQQFGLRVEKPAQMDTALIQPYIIFLHGTAWDSKIWPVAYWNDLATELTAQGFAVFVPWSNDEELKRAKLIADDSGAHVMAKLPLTHLAYHLQHAAFVIGSDTGLSHVAAALYTKTIGIYGSTSAELTGLIGGKVINLSSTKECSPCFKRDCPLVMAGEMIPCYDSVNPQRVLMAIKAFADE
jgi:heptosyltransferase I